MNPSSSQFRSALRKLASPSRAASSQRFFKTAPGQYGHGDKFIGVTVPQQRKLARQFRGMPLPEILKLLKSKLHEERLCALFLLVQAFQKGDLKAKEAVYKAYLANLKHVNNWDLVDSSAGYIVGAWLHGKERGLLYKMAKSPRLWTRRVAMLSTFHFIVNGESKDALKIAELLLNDEEDLMHKASGWMLRELGKRVNIGDLRGFLGKHAAQMPRTMLRYAIEKLAPAERRRWMAVK